MHAVGILAPLNLLTAAAAHLLARARAELLHAAEADDAAQGHARRGHGLWHDALQPAGAVADQVTYGAARSGSDSNWRAEGQGEEGGRRREEGGRWSSPPSPARPGRKSVATRTAIPIDFPSRSGSNLTCSIRFNQGAASSS